MNFKIILVTLCFTGLNCSYALAHSRADLHAPAGVMYEHMHKKGELMLGYNIQSQQQGGRYYSGSHLAASNEMQNYSMLAHKHQMYMHMLHFMYAPTDNLTLTLMPMYMSMNMSMQTNPQQTDSVNENEHMAHGSSASHGVSGWGDTILSASYRAFEDDRHQLITTLGLSTPTGNYKKYGPDGNPVHYGMQIGAGVWQAIPSISYTYSVDNLKIGLQLLTRQPIFNRLNRLGYYAGDQRSATAWLSYLWNPSLSTSVRIQYNNTDTIQGHYKSSHNHGSPADIQTNYGGEQTFAGLGINTLLPTAGGLRVGAEYMIPLHENLNGVQQRTGHILNMSISKSF